MKCSSWARGTVSLSLLCWRWPEFSFLVQLALGGTKSTIFRAVLGGEKRNADFIQKGWKETNSRDKFGPFLLSLPALGTFYLTPHSLPTKLYDWCGNSSWDLLRRYVTVQNAICPFPLPVKTRQLTCHLGTSRPAVLGVFGNDGFRTAFSE